LTGTFAAARNVGDFRDRRSFIPPSGKEERHLGVLLWEMSRARRTGDLYRTRGSIFGFEFSRGALECVVPNFPFAWKNFLISSCRSTFSPAIG